MYRTRFKKDIVAEFLPPLRATKKQKLIILCDGMPSIPRKQSLAKFLASKGYWVIYPRYRGSWESGGEFLKLSPEQDVLDIISALKKNNNEIIEIAFKKKFKLNPEKIFVIGGSFGGATALMCALDARVSKVVATCPVTDWAILKHDEKKETSNPNYADYIREAFGNAYRLSNNNWAKLKTGRFFNPMAHYKEIDPHKVIMFHAKDDPFVPYNSVKKFAQKTGVRLYSFKKGGHLSTIETVQTHWQKIKKFFES